jgi:hypothetical protein
VTASQEEEVAKLAIINNDPRSAADWLTKFLDKYDCLEDFDADLIMTMTVVAKNYTWRAWCNLRRAKSGDRLDKTKRLKLLESVVYDCGFLTGKK